MGVRVNFPKKAATAQTAENEGPSSSAPRPDCPTVREWLNLHPRDPIVASTSKAPAKKETTHENIIKLLALSTTEMAAEKAAQKKHKKEVQKLKSEITRLRKLNRELGGMEEQEEEIAESQSANEVPRPGQANSSSINPNPNPTPNRVPPNPNSNPIPDPTHPSTPAAAIPSSSSTNGEIVAIPNNDLPIDSGSVAPIAESARALRAAERLQRSAGGDGEAQEKGKKEQKKKSKGKARMQGENRADEEVSSPQEADEHVQGDSARPTKRARFASQTATKSATPVRTPSPTPSSANNVPFTPVALKSEPNSEFSPSLYLPSPNLLNFSDDEDSSPRVPARSSTVAGSRNALRERSEATEGANGDISDMSSSDVKKEDGIKQVEEAPIEVKKERVKIKEEKNDEGVKVKDKVRARA